MLFNASFNLEPLVLSYAREELFEQCLALTWEHEKIDHLVFWGSGKARYIHNLLGSFCM